MNERVIFPFTAVVGQERMARALILNAVDPELEVFSFAVNAVLPNRLLRVLWRHCCPPSK